MKPAENFIYFHENQVFLDIFHIRHSKFLWFCIRFQYSNQNFMGGGGCYPYFSVLKILGPKITHIRTGFFDWENTSFWIFQADRRSNFFILPIKNEQNYKFVIFSKKQRLWEYGSKKKLRFFQFSKLMIRQYTTNSRFSEKMRPE